MKKTRNNRGWAIMILLLVVTLQVQAQNLITLKLENKPLPAALKLIEREGGKNVIFSVTETEKHSVSADIRQKTQTEAIDMVLQGTPLSIRNGRITSPSRRRIQKPKPSKFEAR